jgi:hypothetical protein
MNSTIVDAFCLQQAFHDQLATSIHHGDRDGGVVHVHADILFLIHKGAPFRQVGDANNLNLLQKWAPFILRVMEMLCQPFVEDCRIGHQPLASFTPVCFGK